MKLPKPPLLATSATSAPHLRDSIAGEEDPGAALDVVRSLLAQQRPGKPGATPLNRTAPQIHIDCAEGGEHIDVAISWHPAALHRSTPRLVDPSPADLLGLVLAHHGTIANTAWSRFRTTGQRQLALEVDEDEDGVFYVNLKDN